MLSRVLVSVTTHSICLLSHQATDRQRKIISKQAKELCSAHDLVYVPQMQVENYDDLLFWLVAGWRE